jgi:hypothetical protein
VIGDDRRGPAAKDFNGRTSVEQSVRDGMMRRTEPDVLMIGQLEPTVELLTQRNDMMSFCNVGKAATYQTRLPGPR